MKTTPWILGLLLAVASLPISAQRSPWSGADSESGWIIRKTDKGIIKTPRKQKFRFEGSDVSGDVERPSQSVLGARVPRRNTSLIPVRSSFREEFLNVSALPDR